MHSAVKSITEINIDGRKNNRILFAVLLMVYRHVCILRIGMLKANLTKRILQLKFYISFFCYGNVLEIFCVLLCMIYRICIWPVIYKNIDIFLQRLLQVNTQLNLFFSENSISKHFYNVNETDRD